MPSNDLIVYTSIFGDGYILPDVPSSSNASFVCYTDQADLMHPSWKVIQTDPILPYDLVRSARNLKIRPHLYLHEFEKSIYIDPSVELLIDPCHIWDELMADQTQDFAVFRHSFRDTVLDEFVAVHRDQLDSNATLFDHFNTLSLHDPEVLKEKPYWSGFLLRRHLNMGCKAVMEVWWSNVLRYSRRDQLSLNSAINTIGTTRVQVINQSNHETPYHRWPNPKYRRPERYLKDPVRNAIPNLLLMRDLEIQNSGLTTELEVCRTEVHRLRMELVGVQSDVAQLQEAQVTQVNELNHTVEELKRKVGNLQEKNSLVNERLRALRKSRSFRLGNFLLEPLYVTRHALKLSPRQCFRHSQLAGWWWSWRVLRDFRSNPPVTLNDKIRYKMAADRNPILTVFADKWAVREYVSDRVGSDVLTQVYAVVDSASKIPWDDLPDRYVLKATHGSGATIVVDDRASLDAQLPLPNKQMPWGLLARVHPSRLDRDVAEQWITAWLRSNYWRVHGVTEWAYRDVPPRIIVEELIDGEGRNLPADFKFLCVDGKVEIILVTVDRESGMSRAFRKRDWSLIKSPHQPSDEQAAFGVPRPDVLPELIRVAEALSKGIDFVRVDLYVVANRIIFGEMTNYPMAGMEPLYSSPPLSEIGSQWTPHLRNK